MIGKEKEDYSDSPLFLFVVVTRRSLPCISLRKSITKNKKHIECHWNSCNISVQCDTSKCKDTSHNK